MEQADKLCLVPLINLIYLNNISKIIWNTKINPFS